MGLILIFTILFKAGTGSFLSISTASRKQMIEYEINKRKHDISIPSLKASCEDFDVVLNKLLSDIEKSNNSCVQEFYLKIQDNTRDSIYYKIIEKMYLYAYYYEKEITKNGRELFLYQNKNKSCLAYVQLNFVNKENNSLISEIKHFPEYLSCYCE